MKIFTEYTGAEINASTHGRFIKLTTEDENHNGFQFTDGLNVDSVAFDPHETCRRGGMYFCEVQKWYHFWHYNCKNMVYYRNVELPSDARVYVEDEKMKTNKFILGARQRITACKELLLILIRTYSENPPIEYLLEKFESSAFDDDVQKELSSAGIVHKTIAHALRTKSMLNAAMRRDYSAHTLLSFFAAVLFTNETIVRLSLQDDEALLLIPANRRTRSLFDALISAEAYIRLELFDKSFFTQDICNRVIAKRGIYTLHLIPIEMRTAQMLNRCITTQAFHHLSQFADKLFSADVCSKLISAYMNGETRALGCVPDAALTNDMRMAAEVKKDASLLRRFEIINNTRLRTASASNQRITRSMTKNVRQAIAKKH